jgi:hypothetical protein
MDAREVCPEIRQTTGQLCDYVAGHPPALHCTWQNVPLPYYNQHAPEALHPRPPMGEPAP